MSGPLSPILDPHMCKDAFNFERSIFSRYHTIDYLSVCSITQHSALLLWGHSSHNSLGEIPCADPERGT